MLFALINTANNAVVSVDKRKLCDTWYGYGITINMHPKNTVRHL